MRHSMPSTQRKQLRMLQMHARLPPRRSDSVQFGASDAQDVSAVLRARAV
jgi:hypothetical protein